MERYENIIKIEEIRRLIDENLYTKAAKILDTMDVNRIKSLTDLSIVADVLTQNDRYEEAVVILLKIYNKSKTRRVLYQLVDISIRMEDLDKANEYLELYIKLAPTDSHRFIFRYCIDKINQESYETLLESLEQLKEYEYIEMWAYELAKVYHKAGMKDKCVRECSDIILWFGDGVYVEKAKLLKGFYVGDINPAHIIHARNKKEALKQMDLEKTKDYSAMRDEINEYLAKEEKEMTMKQSEDNSSIPTEEVLLVEEYNYAEPIQDVAAVTIEKPAMSESDATIDTKLEPELNLVIDNSIDITIGTKLNTDIDTEQRNKINSESYPEKNNEIKADSVTEKSNQIKADSVTEKNNEIKADNDAEKNIDGNADINKVKVITDLIADNTSEKSVFGYFAKAGFHSEEEFGAFLLVKGIKDQIQNSLENILSDSQNINYLVIAGKKKSGRSTLAKKICKGLFTLDWIKSPNVAKITGDKLNHVNLLGQKEKLTNSAIVVEDASCLTEGTCHRLVDFMKEMRDSVFVILEDEDENLEEFFLKYPFIHTYFTNQIIIGDYSERDLFRFAEEYINKQSYQFLTEAKSEFFLKIGQILSRSDKPLDEVMNLAKTTVKAADSRYKSQLAEILNNRNLDTEDLLYIVKEDILEV